MAFPALTNQTIDGGTQGVNAPGLSLTFPAARTAVVTQGWAVTGNVTCNLATDTLLVRGDGAIWDDTQQAWLNADPFGASGSPRK